MQRFIYPWLRNATFSINGISNQSFQNLISSSSCYSTSMKVAILGVASETGKCLSLFLKQSTLIDELAIYDNKSTRSIALDLNSLDTRCKVQSCDASNECLKQTVENAKIVMIVSDRYPAKEIIAKRILESNAKILSDLLLSVIKYSPRALVAILMNPVNSLIPLALEMYKAAGLYPCNRLFGVTTLDCVRANSFAAEIAGVEPECMVVPVIGGSCRKSIVPLFSQALPCSTMSQKEVIELTRKIRISDDLFLEKGEAAHAGYIARAFAAARFCISLCKALKHENGIIECAYVRSCVIPQVTYSASPLELGPEGIQKYLGIPPLTNYECKLLEGAVPVLKEAITQGEALALGRHSIASSEACLLL